MIAEMGRAAVHEVAARLGMDPREAASRLITLSGSGLPLLVGVECDPNGIRKALSNSMAWGNYAGPPAQNTPSGNYAVRPPTGQHPVQGGMPSGPHPARPAPQQYQQQPPSTPFPVQQPPTGEQPVSTWGPPQSAGWARGDTPVFGGTQVPAGQRRGRVGTALETEGLEGARFSIQLVEVVDPADFLFTAAGYKLADGERAVVVHTELSNRGQVAFHSLPDMYLVLVTNTGETVAKAPVSLSSRPPYKIGVQPGETAGGHTVYVLPESTDVVAVRWSARPEPDAHSLLWSVED